GVRVADDKELLAADVVFVATPPAALDYVAAALKGYAGIIVSAMVPGAGGYELKRDDGTSAAEQLARLVPKGRVVTAFTSISSVLIRDPARGEKPTVFTGAEGPVEGVVVAEFPSMEEAKRWYDSPGYVAVRQHRMRGAKYLGLLVNGGVTESIDERMPQTRRKS